MMRALNSFLRSRDGGTAAEFSLVLPVLLLFLFGIIDVGRLMWTWNKAEKATQMGARYAVATDIVPAGLVNYSFVAGTVTQGDPIPESAFGGADCQFSGSVSCACKSGATCPPLGTANITAFNNIVARMHAIMPEITSSNIVVEYGYSGLGYAGDPNGPDVAPLVTVRLRNLTFTPLLLQMFGGTVQLPDFRASLTLEDGSGTVSN